jgi:hypothetical protein
MGAQGAYALRPFLALSGPAAVNVQEPPRPGTVDYLAAEEAVRSLPPVAQWRPYSIAIPLQTPCEPQCPRNPAAEARTAAGGAHRCYAGTAHEAGGLSVSLLSLSVSLCLCASVCLPVSLSFSLSR